MMSLKVCCERLDSKSSLNTGDPYLKTSVLCGSCSGMLYCDWSKDVVTVSSGSMLTPGAGGRGYGM